MKKGFTLVELIIVIAVIGILAAILIPVFSNVIEKANIKSAMSDAKNAIQIYVAEKTTGKGAQTIKDGTVFVVEKNGNTYYFEYKGNGLVEGGTPATAIAHSATAYSTGSVENFPANVTMYYKA